MHKLPAQEFILKQIKPLVKIGKEGPDFLDARIDESGLDSLELMELVMAIEDQYSIKIDDAVFMDASISIGELINLVEQLVSSPE